MLGHSYLFDLKCCKWKSVETQPPGTEGDEHQGDDGQREGLQEDEAPVGEEPAGDNIDEAEGQEGSIEHEDCFWEAIRDMLLLALYPQLADTVAANGVSDQHVEIINNHIRSLNDIVNGHLDHDFHLGVQIKKPDSSFGTYRLE